jgi:hypothetical protein
MLIMSVCEKAAHPNFWLAFFSKKSVQVISEDMVLHLQQQNTSYSKIILNVHGYR